MTHFPGKLWDGVSSRRVPGQFSPPGPEDRDQMVSEIIATQKAVRDQFRLAEAQIQYIGEPFNPAGGLLEVEVPIEVTDSNGIRSLLSGVTEVTVSITSGTAAGKVLGNGNQTQVVALSEGRGVVIVKATSTGTIALDLEDSAGSGLDVSDTALVTFSS